MKQAKEIRKKIRSVRSIQHITKAMKMVAAAKLRKAQSKMEAIRPYGHRIDALALELTAMMEDYRHPFLEEGPADTPLTVGLITSDKGLCGSYNTNLIRYFERTAATRGWTPDNIRLVIIGRKGLDGLRIRGWNAVATFPNAEAAPPLEAAEAIARELIDPFARGESRAVELIYTRFISTIRYQAETTRLLPFPHEDPGLKALPIHGSHPFIFDPGVKEIADFLMPRVVRTRLYTRLVEAITSEHAARMTSMDSATDKATEMLDELTVTLNKARQESITLELLDIVGGAEALKGR